MGFRKSFTAVVCLLVVSLAYAANPFDGSALPPVYSPKTHIDPVTLVIWKLDPSGYFWNASGYSVPGGNFCPVGADAPFALIQYVRNASPVDAGAIAIASARSVFFSNRNYNAGLMERYADAVIAHATGKGAPVPSIVGKCRIADFNALHVLIQNGVDTTQFNPPEVVFNQR